MECEESGADKTLATIASIQWDVSDQTHQSGTSANMTEVDPENVSLIASKQKVPTLSEAGNSKELSVIKGCQP